MNIKLNKGVFIGVVSGLVAFIIFLILFYASSDFDHQLINKVDAGIPEDKLISQINIESDKMRHNALRRFQSRVINKNLDRQDSESYLQEYKEEMKIISTYDDARKKFATGEISKEQFLGDIKEPREYLELFY